MFWFHEINFPRIFSLWMIEWFRKRKVFTDIVHTGQQIRSKLIVFKSLTFLFLSQTLLCYHSLESSRRNNVNEGHIICLVENWESYEYILVIWSSGSKRCNGRVKIAVWVLFRLCIDSNEMCNNVNAPLFNQYSIFEYTK